MTLSRRTTALAAAGLAGAGLLGGGIAVAATEEPSGSVLLVNGSPNAAADQSAAAGVASRLDGVVLLVTSGSLPSATVSALDSINPARVIVVGGETSISPTVYAQIRAVAEQATVQRVSGADRFDTAAKLAALAGAEPPVTGGTGPQGPAGATGPTGPAGPAGLAGVTGQQGVDGVAGLQGPRGLTGATGADGAKGDTGDAGAKGDTGDAGAKGDTGDAGPAGSVLSVYQGSTRLGTLTSATPSAYSYRDSQGVVKLVSPAATPYYVLFSEANCVGVMGVSGSGAALTGDFRLDRDWGSLAAGMYTVTGTASSQMIASYASSSNNTTRCDNSVQPFSVTPFAPLTTYTIQ